MKAVKKFSARASRAGCWSCSRSPAGHGTHPKRPQNCPSCSGAARRCPPWFQSMRTPVAHAGVHSHTRYKNPEFGCCGPSQSFFVLCPTPFVFFSGFQWKTSGGGQGWGFCWRGGRTKGTGTEGTMPKQGAGGEGGGHRETKEGAGWRRWDGDVRRGRPNVVCTALGRGAVHHALGCPRFLGYLTGHPLTAVFAPPGRPPCDGTPAPRSGC